MKISAVLSDHSARGKKAFIAYLMAGDPSLAATERFVGALSRSGVSVIELGVPHSDPVADGPTIARSAERALKHQVSLAQVLDLVKKLREGGEQVPIILFTYLNPILSLGLSVFAERAKRAGVNGVLVVDLPPEAAKNHFTELQLRGIETVFLASPTTRESRLAKISDLSTGFVYYVSRTGVTGAQSELSHSLEAEVNRLKKEVRRPICVGFGVSTPEQVKEVARFADGVVVGSAFVDLIARHSYDDDAEKALVAKAKELMAPLNF